MNSLVIFLKSVYEKALDVVQDDSKLVLAICGITVLVCFWLYEKGLIL